MICPHCKKNDSSIVHWRYIGESLKRIYFCGHCDKNYPTTERLDSVDNSRLLELIERINVEENKIKN